MTAIRTHEEVAARLGITHQQARHAEKTALAKLRRRLAVRLGMEIRTEQK